MSAGMRISQTPLDVGVAQWIERLAPDQKVGGSIPLAHAISSSGQAGNSRWPFLLFRSVGTGGLI